MDAHAYGAWSLLPPALAIVLAILTRRVILALAAFPAFVYAADVESSNRWYQPGHDPVEIVVDQAGTIAVPQFTGITQVLNKERYKRFSTKVLQHSASDR